MTVRRLDTQRAPTKVHTRKNSRWDVRGYEDLKHPVWGDTAVVSPPPGGGGGTTTLNIKRVDDAGLMYYVLDWVPASYTSGQEFDTKLTVEAGAVEEDRVYCDVTNWNFLNVSGSGAVGGTKIVAKGPNQMYHLKCDLGGAAGTKRLIVMTPTDIVWNAP